MLINGYNKKKNTFSGAIFCRTQNAMYTFLDYSIIPTSGTNPEFPRSCFPSHHTMASEGV